MRSISPIAPTPSFEQAISYNPEQKMHWRPKTVVSSKFPRPSIFIEKNYPGLRQIGVHIQPGTELSDDFLKNVSKMWQNILSNEKHVSKMQKAVENCEKESYAPEDGGFISFPIPLGAPYGAAHRHFYK